MTIASGRPMEDATRIAYRELVRWMAADYGFEELDAFTLLQLDAALLRAPRRHAAKSASLAFLVMETERTTICQSCLSD